MNERRGPNGFLIGLILGGALGVLISTKRGRKILKDIADYGIEYVGNTINSTDLETILNEDQDEEEMFAGEMSSSARASENKDAAEVKTEKIYVRREEKEAHDDQPSRRKRIFKGIRRK